MEEQELVAWAASMDVSDGIAGTCLGHSLSVSSFPDSGGRGLGAVRDLKEGELILTVPKDALFNVDTAKQDPDFRKAWLQFPNLSSTQVLNAFLLREIGKGEASRWYIYLKSLPRFYHTLASYSPFEILALQVEAAVWTAEQAVEKAQKEWRETQPLLEMLHLKRQLLTFKAWLWAASTVSSRTLHIPWDNAGTLCPIGDLFNYAAPGPRFKEDPSESFPENMEFGTSSQVQGAFLKFNRCVSGIEMNSHEEQDGLDVDSDAGSGLHFTDRLTDGGYDETTKMYCFYARHDYKKGEQVLLCYGLYSNLELLEHYGFLLQQNPNDKVQLSLQSFEESSQELVLVPLLGSYGNSSMHIEIDGRPSFQLLAALRLACASAETRKRYGHIALSGLRLSAEGDRTLYEKLKAKCINLLASLPTTLQADIALEHIVSMCSSVDGLAGLLELLGDTGNYSALSPAGCKLLEDAICGWGTLSTRSQLVVLDEVQRFLHSLDGVNVRKEGHLRLERWSLAIKWRQCYKKILHRCIVFCDHRLLSL